MRLWHYKLLPYLPDAQFKGQLRELVAIMRAWRDYGKTNHLLINRVMEYPRNHLVSYAFAYFNAYENRFTGKKLNDFRKEFFEFGSFGQKYIANPFPGWHNDEYLRVNMANLFEKYKFGSGSSKITEKEWQKLLEGYADITGNEYFI